MKKHSKLIIITLATLLFILILRDVFIYEVTSYDNWAYDLIVSGKRNEELTLVMKLISTLGSAAVLISLVFLILAFTKNKTLSLIALLNLLFEHILNDIIKLIVRRPRPEYGLIKESNYSFPSGHSMAATAFYGLIIYLVYKHINNKKLKVFLITLLSLLIVAICVSRIYLGVHYFSDTLAGVLITIVYLIIFISITNKLVEDESHGKERKENKTKTKH